MSPSTIDLGPRGGALIEPTENSRSRHQRRVRAGSTIGALCLAALLGACGDSGSSDSTSGPPAELRDYPYCEIIPDTVADDTLTEHIFNTLPFGPCLTDEFASVTEQDIVDAYNAAYDASSTSATVNGVRHWVLDTITSTGGVTSSTDTLTVDGIKFGLVGQLQTPVGDPTIGSQPYVVNTVQRNTIYTFKKGLHVFELTDPSGNVYVMQSYSQQVDPSLTLRTLPDIGPTNQLPEGWSYAARRLTEDLTLTASGSTHIVNDSYRNTYQINPEAS